MLHILIDNALLVTVAVNANTNCDNYVSMFCVLAVHSIVGVPNISATKLSSLPQYNLGLILLSWKMYECFY